ncbi:hypothetical protein Tco_0680466 [Tanacetum coccineum]|uniref:Transposase (putative) gypsy type domain-containing protein n=1 Tax=Tanacetum coccineum TaxID=301880 RepID=A0ABQ4XLG8_9ASTR
MSELSDDAIGVYHHIFDFSGVRIPFSLFLLALIKHCKVHFSQLGPLGLNKVVTFEVLCWSLQIEPTVTLFRVFQTLCKQGHWFYFANRRAPSPVCIDDNRSCMKHWKSGFFLIDQRAIPDYMSWRHPNSAINDLKPLVGSFNMEDMRRLSAHVVKLRDMPEGVMGIHDFLCQPEWTGVTPRQGGNTRRKQEWISSQHMEEPHHDIRPTLQRLPFYCTPSVAVDAAVPDLAAGNPSAKAEASQKRKAFTSGATSSHVAKRTRSALAQSSGIEILLVTPIRSADVIPSSGNQSSGSATLAAEGPRAQGKGIMTDAVAASFAGVSRPRPSSGLASLFRDISEDAIHIDFFPFISWALLYHLS